MSQCLFFLYFVGLRIGRRLIFIPLDDKGGLSRFFLDTKLFTGNNLYGKKAFTESASI